MFVVKILAKSNLSPIIAGIPMIYAGLVQSSSRIVVAGSYLHFVASSVSMVLEISILFNGVHRNINDTMLSFCLGNIALKYFQLYAAIFLKTCFCIFPVAVFGSSSSTTTFFGV